MTWPRCGGAWVVCLIAAVASLAHGETDPAVRRGRILCKSGKYNEAIAELREAVKRNPRNSEALLWLGRSHARVSEFNEAVECLEKAVRMLPDGEDARRELLDAYVELATRERARQRPQTSLDKAQSAADAFLKLPPKERASYVSLSRFARQKAERFHEAGQSDGEREMLVEALGYCDRAIELKPNGFSSALDRVRILIELKRFAEAENRCREVLKADPLLYRTKLLLAQIRRAEGDYDGAIKILSELLAARRHRCEALLDRAEIHLDLQKYDEALADTRDVLVVETFLPRTKFIRGCAFMQLGKLDTAILDLQQAASWMPRHVPAHFWLARCLLLKGRHREAVEQLNTVLKLDPRFTVARLILASVQIENGEPDAAIATLEEAMRIDPKNSEVYRLLGDVYNRKGDSKRAESMYDKMLELEHTPARAAQIQAALALAKGKVDEAIQHCLEALKTDPRNTDIHFLLGLAYLRKGSLDEAQAQFEEVLRLGPHHVATRLRLAEIHTRRREFALAQRQLEACIAQDAELLPPRYELARLFALQGQFDKAQAELEKLLTLDPDRAKAQRALDELGRRRSERPEN